MVPHAKMDEGGAYAHGHGLNMLPDQPEIPKRRLRQLAAEPDFRDHIATADAQGRRKWIYPRRVNGKFYRWRTWFSWLLLAIMFSGPFITINGNPLLLVNIPQRKFIVLGQIFWPQDLFIFAIAALLFVVMQRWFVRGMMEGLKF